MIQGRVQGVGYRAFCLRSAIDLDIGGYARNLPDGSVSVGAYGESEKMDQFWNRLREGPPLSLVTKLIVTDRTSIGDPQRFEIVF